MNFEDLKQRLEPVGLGHKVLMGVGPMSKNCVDALIEMNSILKFPIQLIASRRQIECKELGGGYVNSWTTEEFAKYVREQDKSGCVMLCRDHGGPWQGAGEADLSPEEALERAKVSYKADILAGFDVIHLDPSLKDRPMKAIQKDVEALLEHCESVAGEGNQLVYEVGTEETNGKITDTKDFEDFVKFCTDLSPKIRFVVGQTGTLVKEVRNVGTYDGQKARELVAICNRHGVYLKEHNLDYVSEIVLQDHRPAGIHSTNIAPEFGVVETTKLLELLQTHKLKKERKRFIAVANESKKWEKWVISELTDEQKAILAGHYVFDHPDVREICDTLRQKMYLDEVLKAELYLRFIKYLKAFRWIV